MINNKSVLVGLVNLTQPRGSEGQVSTEESFRLARGHICEGLSQLLINGGRPSTL